MCIRDRTLQEAVTRAEELCNGLKAIHEKGIVHRDIQPKNIIISNEGTLKIIDFDISRKENHEKSLSLIHIWGEDPL